ncbi:MAG: TonB-dependent receptor [Myxococcota bacterium]|nr:TonB-dependent receptor [Myxococcota bacterium]
MRLFRDCFRFATVSLLGIAVSILPGAALAEEEGGVASLDLAALMDLDIVVAATGKATSLKDAPSIVSVINDKDIRAAGYRTVGEALRTVPGLSIVDDHVETNVGIRGFFANSDSASDILKLMINSQPVAFRPTSSNFFGFDLIPIQAVKRIEIIRGPASSLYGANAFLGVVNVVTKTGTELNDDGFGGGLDIEGFQLKTDASSSNNYSGSVMTGGHDENWGLDWILTAAQSEADRSGLALPETATGWGTSSWSLEKLQERSPTVDDTATEASFYGSISKELGEYGEYGKISGDMHVQKRDKSGEFTADSALTHQTRIAMQNSFMRLGYESAREDEGGFYWDIQMSYADSKPLAADQIFDEKFASNNADRDLLFERDWSGTALSAALELNYAFNDTDTVTLGFDYDKDTENLLTAIRVFEGEAAENNDGYGERVFENKAVYGQVIWNVVEGFTVTTGARVDNNSAIACNTEDWDCMGEQTVELTPPTNGFSDEDQTTTTGGSGQMSSRLALVYHPADFELGFIEDFYLKVAYGSSYKAPTPYQLYHRRITGKGSAGTPVLTPQTADTIEAQIGLDFSGNIALTAGWFTLDTRNLVISVLEEGSVVPSSRNADAKSSGLEFTLGWNLDKWLKVNANLSYLLDANLTPRQPADETDDAWANDPTFNVANIAGPIPAPRYPKMMANLSAVMTLDDYYTRLGLNIHHVGERDASLHNNAQVNALDLFDTYSLDAYTLMRVNLSSTGLYLISDYSETVFSLMYVGPLSGTQIDPGSGGVDIPGFGQSLFVKMTQNF